MHAYEKLPKQTKASLYNWGVACFKVARRIDAKEKFEAALKMDPEFQHAKDALAMLMKVWKDSDKDVQEAAPPGDEPPTPAPSDKRKYEVLKYEDIVAKKNIPKDWYVTRDDARMMNRIRTFCFLFSCAISYMPLTGRLPLVRVRAQGLLQQGQIPIERRVRARLSNDTRPVRKAPEVEAKPSEKEGQPLLATAFRCGAMGGSGEVVWFALNTLFGVNADTPRLTFCCPRYHRRMLPARCDPQDFPIRVHLHTTGNILVLVNIVPELIHFAEAPGV